MVCTKGPTLAPAPAPAPKCCISSMIANKFGVSTNAELFIYDSNNTYHSYQATCNTNPEYASYCFDPKINKDGDSVTFVVHGYMIKHAYDVSNCNML